MVYNLDRTELKELKEEPFVPVRPARLSGGEGEPLDVFSAIRQGDILVQHPYESFAESVEAFITQASRDPDVLAIKQTLYRTSGDSPIVRALIRAAERGKQVAALVELKARGDEAANIGWARALEEAGVHVVYGLVGLKTHSKTSLVVRQEGDGIRRYCHIGTGNYNSNTARLYEDIGILTASPEIGADLTDLFNFLTGYSRRVEYRRLLVAPTVPAAVHAGSDRARGGARRGRPHRVETQQPGRPGDHRRPLSGLAGGGARSIWWCGPSVACDPGIPGLSDHIRVRSIVGRWLEHSRIYYFGADGGQYLLGSADMMERNLDRRVEAIVPIAAPEMRARLQEILDLELADDTRAWQLESDGTWHKVPTTAGVNAQQSLQELAITRSRRRRETEVLHGAPRG